MLSDKQLKEFEQDYLQGLKVQELKKKYSIGSNGLFYRVLNKLNLDRRQGQYPSKEEFVEYYINQNHSFKDTKKYFDLSTKTFYKCIEMYQVVKSEEAKVKRTQQTMLERYGKDNALKLPEIKEKVYQTMKTNGTLGKLISQSEKEVEELLYSHFKESDIERNYKDDLRYPFKCDFYIKSLDLFIEFNGSHYHGNRNRDSLGPFDPLNPKHLKELKHLKQLEKSHPIKEDSTTQKTQYTRMIKVWTQEDPLKRETAKKNNLNFKEFWSLQEVKEWLKSI